jgi:hypothetical protein
VKGGTSLPENSENEFAPTLTVTEGESNRIEIKIITVIFTTGPGGGPVNSEDRGKSALLVTKIIITVKTTVGSHADLKVGDKEKWRKEMMHLN